MVQNSKNVMSSYEDAGSEEVNNSWLHISFHLHAFLGKAIMVNGLHLCNIFLVPPTTQSTLQHTAHSSIQYLAQRRLEEPGFEPQTFWSVEDPLYLSPRLSTLQNLTVIG